MKKKKSFFAIFLICVLFVCNAPLRVEAALTTPPTVNENYVLNRLSDLARKLGINNGTLDVGAGAYFTVNQQPCGYGLSGHGCDNCKNSLVVNTAWFKNIFGTVSSSGFPKQYGETGNKGSNIGYSCWGFANFAMWYANSTSNTDDIIGTFVGTTTFSKANIQSLVKPGNIIRCNGHSMIFISAGANSIKVMDCNAENKSGNCRVRIREVSYSSYAGMSMGITRAGNYEPYYSCNYDLYVDPNGGTLMDGSTTVIKASPQLSYGGGNWWNMADWAPVRDGYFFNGWFTEPSGGIKVYNSDGTACNEGTYFLNDVYVHAGDLKVYAQWSKLYNLYFDPNGGSFGDGSTSVIQAPLPLIYGGGHWWDIAGYTPTKAGYELEGFYTRPVGGVKVYNADGKACNEGVYWNNNCYMYANDLTVYAHWTDRINPVVESSYIKDVDATGYTVVCTVTDNEEVARVCFPAWTMENWQDDLNLNWYDDAAIIGQSSDNTYTFRINVSDHNNESGTYVTHVYAYDISGNYTYIATVDVVVPKRFSFPDVKVGSWYYDFVEDVYEKGYMSGRGDGTFGPDIKLTRAEIATIIYKMADESAGGYIDQFVDVPNGKWYSEAVSWAYRNNIVSGYGNGKFGVSDNVTREQLAQMLYSYAKMKGYDITYTDGIINRYGDSMRVSNWAKPAMNWAISKGIISGKGKGTDLSQYKLDPNGSTTRAECAAMLKNFMDMN